VPTRFLDSYYLILSNDFDACFEICVAEAGGNLIDLGERLNNL
jgi:hypothetical protein